MRTSTKETRLKITKQEIQVGRLVVPYQVIGNGEPMILIHGLSGSSRWWVRNVRALGAHYRLYLLDLPGFGNMRHLPQHYALDEIASVIVLWMDAVGLTRAHLVGHSMGGYISLWIAASYPERIQSLILISPAGIPHQRSIRGYVLPLLQALHTFNLHFSVILLSDVLRAGPHAIVRAAQDLFTKDIRDCLKDISAPTLLIWGEHDSLIPPVFGPILHQKIKQAHLLLLKHAGHVAMFDQPEAFNAAVLAFLADQEKGM